MELAALSKGSSLRIGESELESGAEGRIGLVRWLQGFIAGRGLAAPDQRALHAYHCTQEEYAALRQLLGVTERKLPIVGDVAASACFVLFGAEWYRREYLSRDAWSWDPLFIALGRRLSQVQLPEVMHLGLERYWKRPLHFYESSRRDFLGSVFGEGGLPSSLLRESGSRFQVLFDRLLRQYDDAHLLGLSTVELTRRLLGRVNLPQVFTTPDSTGLIAEMADRLVDLVRDYTLDQAAAPVARVNDLNPKWREGFPLPLDDETGSQLLAGLLKTATDEGSKRRKRIGAWKCAHFWDERDPGVLSSRVTLPDQVELELKDRPTTTRFELALAEDGLPIARLGAGYGEIIGDGHRVRVRVRRSEVIAKRRKPAATLNFVLLAGGSIVAAAAVPLSAVAIDEAPVGFEPSGERWQLCGQASFSAAGRDLLIALPDEIDVKTTRSEECIAVTDAVPICGVRAVHVSGKGEVLIGGAESGDAIYRVRTGRARQADSGLELAGNQLGWPTQPSLAFVGLPKVRVIGGGDAPQPDGAKLYIGSTPVGTTVPQAALGTQFASLRSGDGDVLLRRKIGVLPSDFQIDLSGGDKPTNGFINVRSKTRCLVQLKTSGVTSRQSRQSSVVQLVVQSDGIPPATVRVAVTPNLEADPILFDLPFPSSGCLAYDRDGGELARDLSVDDLAGSRLMLFGSDADVAVFTLELALHGGIARSAYYRWSYTVGASPAAIELFGLRDEVLGLLSLRPDVDQAVELHVWDNGRRHEARFKIRRYASQLSYDDAGQRLVVDAPQCAAATIPEPRLMLLHDAKRPAIALEPCKSEGVPTSQFSVPTVTTEDGPWLVVPKPRSGTSFRPLYIAGTPPDHLLDGEIHSLEEASTQFDPRAAESTFISVLSEMADNLNHSGWSFLRSLYESYGYLPLSTFKVWEALVLQSQQALATAVLKFDADSAFITRIEQEFPILWELFPLPALRYAVHARRKELEEGGLGSEAVVRDIVARTLEHLALSIPAYDETIRAYLLEEPPTNRLGDIPPQIILKPWYQDLLRDSGESDWPTFEGARLEQWAHSNTVLPLPFMVDDQYRKSVVYLPIFSAAVAAGRAAATDVFVADADTVFMLRKVRDFDTKWFNSMYRYYLSLELAARTN